MNPDEFKPKLLFFALKEPISQDVDGFFPSHRASFRYKRKVKNCSEDEVADGLYDAIRKACSDENANTLKECGILRRKLRDYG